METSRRLFDEVAAQRPHLFLWVPVAFAIGIAAYFAPVQEPPPRTVWLVFAGGAVCAGLAVLPGLRVPALLACAALAGFGNAAWRAQWLAAPVLEARYYGPVSGVIAHVDRSVSDRPRITLAEVRLGEAASRPTPLQVRITLHGPDPPFPLLRGTRVMATAHLSPPGDPVEPGGFDFRRRAWFQQVGAVGYTRTSLLRFGDGPDAAPLVARLRDRLRAKIRAEIPGRTGAFATAIVTGDRAGVEAAEQDALRASNLAHLLAISGLHMGLLTGAVFAAVRLGLALFPWLAMRLPARGVAAAFAIWSGAGYLLISGAGVASQRAFVMVAIMFLAVCLGRRAVTLQSVAIAALIVLAATPESLLEPGFQMSFAATASLVAVFNALTRHQPAAPRGWLANIARPVGFLVLSSAVAGAATAPFAALHFNRIAGFGLIANLLGVPVMGLAVMPAALAGVVAWPIGIDGPAWAVMGLGIDWILKVAETVAAWPGAVTPVAKPPGSVVALLGTGLAVLILWQGLGRLAGAAILVAALVVWGGGQRPVVLISADGGLIGVLSDGRRTLSRQRGQGFAARLWLENDGTLRTQAEAGVPKGAPPVLVGDGFTVGWSDSPRPASGCDGHAVLVMPAAISAALPGCLLIGQDTLAAYGAIALDRTDNGFLLRGTRTPGARRLWSPPPVDQ